MAGVRTPDAPTQLPRRSWWAVLKRTGREFLDDDLTDWAATLTYYAVMSLFPGLLLLTALVGLLGPGASAAVLDSIQQLGPGQARDVLVTIVRQVRSAQGAAGPLAVLSLVVAVWSASGYVGAFIRAANAIYDVAEGRPWWKTIPLRLGLTAGVVVLLALTGFGIAATGEAAGWLGRVLHLGHTVVTAWDVAKWPVLLLLASAAIGLLFWASPNVRQPSWLWITPGGLLAVLSWAVATAGFGLYVAHSSSYNMTYGSLAGVVVFLVWLWISNLALLLGAELDAELERGRRIAEGQPERQEPVAPPRDTEALR